MTPRARSLALLVVLFILSLPAVTVRFYASDEIQYFAYLRSMWFDRDLSFDNEYRYFYDRGVARAWRFKEAFLDGVTPTGKRVNFAPVGSAVLWSPFYAVTDAGVVSANALGASIVRDGYQRPYIAAVVYASALYGFLALLLSAHAASQIVGSVRASTAAVLAAWAGTPLLFYMYLAPGFSHACSAFAVAAFVVIWLHVRTGWSPGGVAALGAMAGIMGLVREQDMFVALGPALDFTVTSVRRWQRREWRASAVVMRAMIGTVATAVCFLPQILAYIVLNGRPGPSPTIEAKMTWTSPHAWLVLASPQNGLVFWTPLAAVAIVGLAVLAANRGYISSRAVASSRGDFPWVGLICMLMVATQIYVSGNLDTWAGAGSFGQRRLVGLTIFWVIGLAALLRATQQSRGRLAMYAVLVLAVWWNIGLTVQFGSGLMSRRNLELHHNAYHNFVTIPLTLPQMAYRYFVDRGSFYQTRAAATP